MSELYAYFDEKVRRWREHRSGRFTTKPPETIEVPPKPQEFMWRYTLAYNFVYHHNYFSYVIQYWSLIKDINMAAFGHIEEVLEEELKDAISNQTQNYTLEELADNGMWLVRGEGWQKLPLDERLIGKTEIRDEYLGYKYKARTIIKSKFTNTLGKMRSKDVLDYWAD